MPAHCSEMSPPHCAEQQCKYMFFIINGYNERELQNRSFVSICDVGRAYAERGDRLLKFAVQINYKIKKVGAANAVVTAGLIEEANLREYIKIK